MSSMSTGGRVLLALLAVGTVAGACGFSGGSSATTSTAPPLPGATVTVQGEFAGNETFCADQPLAGTINYEVSGGQVRLKLDVQGLPAKSTVIVNWLNNSIRGYVIGEFVSNPAGDSVPTSLRIYRPGETHGYEVQLASSDAQGAVLGVLRPCAG